MYKFIISDTIRGAQPETLYDFVSLLHVGMALSRSIESIAILCDVVVCRRQFISTSSLFAYTSDDNGGRGGLPLLG